MQRRIYGVETEFGVTCTFHGQRRLSPDEVARYLFRRVVSWGRSSNVFLRNGAGRIRMSAVVHEGAGFRAAAVRSVVTGIAMLSKVPFPHHIFATVEQAAKWLGTTHYRDVDPDYTVFAVNEARDRAALQMLRAHER